jgi:hypothetical protein
MIIINNKNQKSLQKYIISFVKELNLWIKCPSKISNQIKKLSNPSNLNKPSYNYKNKLNWWSPNFKSVSLYLSNSLKNYKNLYPYQIKLKCPIAFKKLLTL